MEAGLTGKVALVTGGGRGLGERTCRVLARAGAHVVVADPNGPLAEEVAASILRQGGSASPLRLDLAKAEEAKVELDLLAAGRGRLDVLVNHASINVSVPADQLRVQDWDHIAALNLRGPFLLSRHALPVMARRGTGYVVNIAATVASRAWANAAAYHAGKWGLLKVSRALQAEAAQAGVRVSAVVSGGARTPFLLDSFPELAADDLQEQVAQAVRSLLTLPPEAVVPELMIMPLREPAWR